MELSNIIIVGIASIIGAWLVAWSGAHAEDLLAPPILRSTFGSTLVMLMGSFGPAILSIFLLAWWSAPIVWIATAIMSNVFRTRSLKA